jgi:hypothetical protein
MVDTPREGRAAWAALAASRGRASGPRRKPRFVPLSESEASASSPRKPLIRVEASGAEKAAPHDVPHEGGDGRTELVAWLKKWISIDDNRTFESSELVEIKREIRELRAEVSFLTELNLEQQEALNQSLEEIQSGSERLGRKDWLTYAIGVGTSLVIAEVVPPLALLPLAVHAFHALSHLLIPATPASP